MKLADSIDKYLVYELLGRGGFAEVYRAVELITGAEVAIKKISKQSVGERKMWDRVKQELAIHTVLEHSSIVGVHTCFQDSEYIYLVLEFCPNGELFKLLEERNAPFNENQARGVLKQVLAGLKYLHSHRIIHRDITLSNLLLTRDWNVKIADFGLAVKFSQLDEKHKTMCGTPNYIAPEVVTRKEQGPETDIWNVGIMLYTLLVGKPPFDTDYGGVKITFKKVVTSEVEWPAYLSHEVVNLMDLMLKKDPTERITSNEIFNHPFMKHATCEDLRMLTPATFTRDDDDSGFLTSSLTWLTTGEASSSNTSVPVKFAVGATGYSSRGRASPYNQVHSGNCCSSYSNCSNQPLRPCHYYNPSLLSSQLSASCSHASKHSALCSQVNSCACSLMSRSSLNGCSNYRETIYKSLNSISENGIPENISQEKHQAPRHFMQDQATQTAASVPAPYYSGVIRTLPPELLVPPLSTARLRPKWREKGKTLYFSILNSGQVCLEFFKEHNTNKFTEILVITSNGMQVSVQRPYDERYVQPGQGVTIATYSYEDLPEKFLKKYQYAAKCINNEKSVTSKVIYFSQFGKCHLMENGPDANFTLHFYSGEKMLKKGSQVEILDCNYVAVSKLHMNDSGDLLQPQLKILWDHFKKCWEECLKREKDLEELCTRSDDITWFPNTSGQKPNFQVRSNVKKQCSEPVNKENDYQGSIQKQQNRAVGSAPSSLIARSASSISQGGLVSGKYKLLKKVTVPDIGTAYQMSSGLVSVNYLDNSKLDVQPSSSSAHTTLFTFTDENGQKSEYPVNALSAPNFSPHIFEKVSLYRAMVEKLKNA